VGFAVDKVALPQVFLLVLRFSPLIMSPPKAQAHILMPPFIRTIGRSLGSCRYCRAVDRPGLLRGFVKAPRENIVVASQKERTELRE